jgi:hypothetical protein
MMGLRHIAVFMRDKKSIVLSLTLEALGRPSQMLLGGLDPSSQNRLLHDCTCLSVSVWELQPKDDPEDLG